MRLNEQSKALSIGGFSQLAVDLTIIEPYIPWFKKYLFRALVINYHEQRGKIFGEYDPINDEYQINSEALKEFEKTVDILLHYYLRRR